MTVSSQTNKLRAVGNGVASAFPLPFRFFANSEISALFVERATGVTTPAVIGTDYTLTGAGDPEVNGSATGVLTTTVPLAATRDLIVIRTLPTIQATDIVNQGEFFASTHEDVFDRLTMIGQQQSEELSRCVKTSVSDTITPDQLLDSIRQSEQNAANSAGESAAQAAASAASAAAAAATYDDFDDRYLGAKATDPTTDNDGNPLQTGALYWNTPAGKMKAWSGSAWSFLPGDISGPASSTDTAIAIFDGASGKQVKGSAAKVNAAGDVISNGAQVGQSGTASNNFHWRNLLDGLLRLSRGGAGSLPAGDNAADVMRVKADNSVEFPGGYTGSADDEKRRCTAWVNFNGVGTVTIRNSYNVSSITDIGVGIYDVNFTTSMNNPNYVAIATAGTENSGQNARISAGAWSGGIATPWRTNSFRVGAHVLDTLTDVAQVNVAFFGGK